VVLAHLFLCAAWRFGLARISASLLRVCACIRARYSGSVA